MLVSFQLNKLNLLRTYEISTEANNSKPFALLFYLEFKFVNNFVNKPKV